LTGIQLFNLCNGSIECPVPVQTHTIESRGKAEIFEILVPGISRFACFAIKPISAHLRQMQPVIRGSGFRMFRVFRGKKSACISVN
jgi:hypothetical protein